MAESNRSRTGTPNSTESRSKSALPKMDSQDASAESGGEKRKRQNLSDSSSGSEAEGKSPKKKTSDSKPAFPRRLRMSPVMKMCRTRRVSHFRTLNFQNSLILYHGNKFFSSIF